MLRASEKARRENEQLRAALADVFVELQKVQSASTLAEALALPAVVQFTKVSHYRIANEFVVWVKRAITLWNNLIWLCVVFRALMSLKTLFSCLMLCLILRIFSNFLF